MGGWCRSLKDARVSAQAWEQSANRKQREGFSFGRPTSLLLSALTTLFSQIGGQQHWKIRGATCRRHPGFHLVKWNQSIHNFQKRIGTLAVHRRQCMCLYIAFGLSPVILIVFCRQPSGFYRPRVLAGTLCLKNTFLGCGSWSKINAFCSQAAEVKSQHTADSM